MDSICVAQIPSNVPIIFQNLTFHSDYEDVKNLQVLNVLIGVVEDNGSF